MINEAMANNMSLSELTKYGSPEQIAAFAVELDNSNAIKDLETEVDELVAEVSKLVEANEEADQVIDELIELLTQVADQEGNVEVHTLRDIENEIRKYHGGYLS